MSDYKWPLTIEEVDRIVDHLLSDGTREGTILADSINTAMGRSARRRKAREQQEQQEAAR